MIYDYSVTNDKGVFSMESFDREQYLEQLRVYYSGDRDSLEQFLLDMGDSLDCYLEEYPNASAEEIYQRFGHPEEFRAAYEAGKQECRLHRKDILKRIRNTVLLVVGVLFLVCVLYYGYHEINDALGNDTLDFHIARPDYTFSPTVEPQSTSAIHTEY
jgi:hypothetical protein